MMTQVCKGCTERHPACWGGCAKYQAARAEHERQKQAKAADREKNSALNHVQYYGLAKFRKERGNK